MQHLPGNTIRTAVLAPTLSDIEDLIKIYSLALYKKDKRGYIMYHQKAILVTTDTIATIKREIVPILDKINEYEDTTFFSEILTFDDLLQSKSNKKPFDSKIIHIQSPFILAKKSPVTNTVYPVEKMYCPDTGRRLHHCISTDISTTSYIQ